MSGIHKQKPLKLEGDEKTPRIAAGTKKLGEQYPMVEYEEYPEEWKGDLVSIQQIKGYLVIFHEYQDKASSFEEGGSYIVAQIQIGEEFFVLRTGSKAVCGAIRHMAKIGKFPMRAFVEHRKGKWPAGYYCLSSEQGAPEEES